MPLMGTCDKCGSETMDYLCPVCLCAKVEELQDEIDRLKRGDFTEEGGKEMIPSDPLHNLFCRIAADRELADNVIVHCGLQTWRHSNQSQEEVLIETIHCLVRQNAALLETAGKISERSVQPIIVPPKSP